MSQVAKKIIAEKVIGKIKADHTEEGHFYILPSGKRVSSVTTKLIIEKKHLIPWAVEQGVKWLEIGDRWEKLKTEEREEYMTGAKFAFTDIRDEAGNIGTFVHQIIEDYLKEWMALGKRPKDITSFIPAGTDYRVHGATRAREAIFEKYNVIPVASEILVGDEKMNCAGTLDEIMFNLDTNSLELWDTKTSNQVDTFNYALQVAAYKAMFQKMTGLRIKVCRVNKYDKFSNRYESWILNDYMKALRAFNHLSKVYDYRENVATHLTRDKKIIKI